MGDAVLFIVWVLLVFLAFSWGWSANERYEARKIRNRQFAQRRLPPKERFHVANHCLKTKVLPRIRHVVHKAFDRFFKGRLLGCGHAGDGVAEPGQRTEK